MRSSPRSDRSPGRGRAATQLPPDLVLRYLGSAMAVVELSAPMLLWHRPAAVLRAAAVVLQVAAVLQAVAAALEVAAPGA